MQSSYLDPMTTYAVGTLRDDALHLTPLAGIYQVGGSFLVHASNGDWMPGHRSSIACSNNNNNNNDDDNHHHQMRASCEHVDAANEEEEGGGAGAGPDGGLGMAEDEESEGEEGGAGAGGRAKAGGASSSAGGTAAPPVKLQHIEYKKRESEKAAAVGWSMDMGCE